ncbi:MAG: 50S ribosomal protein L4 [Candidatus Aenigmarchaeota archaeon]|nr:50S ribosomal protein L4 [Candidatus Aenigmarchaeota archaeon]
MAKIYDLNGNAKEEVKLPKVFDTPYRPDVIKKAVLSLQSSKRQAYGSDVLAGKRTSAHYHGLRRYRWSMMGRGMSRMARIHGKVGYLLWRARFVPQAVKGRRAHPPKVEKKWEKKINEKEMMLAIRSALAACCNIELIKKRGHVFDGELPIIFEKEFENLKTTKEVLDVLKKVGIEKELERSKKKKVVAGRGKMRNRKYKKKKGILIVVSKECSLMKAARNLPGVDVLSVEAVDVESLAPGCHAGRLTIFTKPAIEMLDEV